MRWAAVGLLLLAAGMLAGAEEPEISWNTSLINVRRKAATRGWPIVVLFYDRLLAESYDTVLARDEKLRSQQRGFTFVKVDRGAEQDLVRKLGVRAPWEVRIVAPDLTPLQALTGRPKAAEIAKALESIRKVWEKRGGPGGIDWLYSFDAAVRIAKEKKRPLLLYFWSDAERGSSPEENPVFKDASIIQLTKKFVCVKLNQSVDEDLFERFQVRDLPQILFLRPNEERCGESKPEDVATAMKDIVLRFGEERVETRGKR